MRTPVGLLVAGFAGLGATASLVPAALPQLAIALGSGVADGAVPALFGGLLAGVLIGARFPHRVRSVVAVASLVQAASTVALVMVPSAALALTAVLLAGAGFGAAESGLSVLTKSLAVEGTGRRLSGLTAVVAVVALALPLTIAGGVPLLAVALVVGVLHLIVCAGSIGLSARPRPQPRGEVRSDAADATGAVVVLDSDAPSNGDAGAIAGPDTIADVDADPHPDPDPADARGPRSAVPVLAAVALGLYVGAESVLSGWSAVIPAALLDLDVRGAALGTSAFWGLMAAGRLLAAVAVDKLGGARRYLAVGAGGAAAASSIAALEVLPPALRALLLALAVLLVAPAYSLPLGDVLDRVDAARAPAAVAILVASGAAGGLVIPLAIALMTSPTSAATLAVVAVAFAAVAFYALTRPRPRHP